MRILSVPAALVAALVFTPAAFAATQTATGTIKSVDMKAHSLTLSDGSTYMLPTSLDTKTLKTGEKVSISWNMRDHKHEASSVRVVN